MRRSPRSTPSSGEPPPKSSGRCARSSRRWCSSSASKASRAAPGTRAALRCAFRACCGGARTSRSTRPIRLTPWGRCSASSRLAGWSRHPVDRPLRSSLRPTLRPTLPPCRARACNYRSCRRRSATSPAACSAACRRWPLPDRLRRRRYAGPSCPPAGSSGHPLRHARPRPCRPRLPGPRQASTC